MQAPAGGADARGQQVLDRGLRILLFERDVPAPLRMLLADCRQALSDRRKLRRGEQSLLGEHLRMRDGGANVVAHQTFVQLVVLPRGEFEDASVKGGSLVPKPAHDGCFMIAAAAPPGSTPSNPRPPACRCL